MVPFTFYFFSPFFIVVVYLIDLCVCVCLSLLGCLFVFSGKRIGILGLNISSWVLH